MMNEPGIDRRGAVAVAALATAGLLWARPASTATSVSWVGWQGYDEPLKLGTFLADNGIDLAAT
jgi:hypothetical protein